MSAVVGDAASRGIADPSHVGRLLDSVDLPILVVDCDVTVVRFNTAAATVLSLAPSDVGRPLRQVPVLTQLTDELHELCERVVGGAPPLQRRVRANGSWFLVRIVPHLKDGDEVAGAVITVTNVTGVLAGVEQAIIERQHAKMILNTVGTPLLVLDADLAVRTANRAFFALFDVSRDETIGVAFSRLGDGQWDIPELASELQSCLREGKEFEAFEVEREFPSIGRKTVLLTARPLPSETKNGPSLLLMIEDVSARRQAEVALRDSERQLSDFFENGAVGLHWVGPDGTILRANQAELNLLGYTRDEYVGRKIAEFHADRALVDDILRRLNHGETLSAYPARMRCKDGSIKHVLIDSNVLWGEKGDFIHARCFTRDVTQAVRAEESLRQRTAQFETLLNEAPLGVYLVDADSRIRQVNPTALPVFGTIEDVVGRDFDEVMHILWPKPYADEVVERFRHTLQTGEPYATPERIEKRLDTGVTEYYEWQIHRIPLPEGSRGVVCYFRDISREVLAKQALEEVDRRKDEFIAMLAHELRNPLAAIVTGAELLRRARMDDENTRVAVPAILRQTMQLRRLVDDLLDTARGLHGKLRLQREPLRLLNLAKSVAADYLARSQQVDVVGGEVWIEADPARVQQIIGNLVENAFKYGARSVWIRVGRDDRFGRLVVQDDGHGIARDLLPNLFQPFVQGGQSLDRQRGGLGLGLALVHRLSVLHGGGIEAHSEGPGRGSTFTVILPLAAKPAFEVEETKIVAAGKRRILIIEDQEDTRLSLRLLLEKDGHEVSTASTGTEGLAKLADLRPDVALIDIGLPGFDGYEVARRARELPTGKQVRLIALTGYGAADDRARAKTSGFDMHLTKPVAYDKLVLALGA